jgi:hypothetical protein
MKTVTRNFGDSAEIWQQRADKAREQELAVLAILNVLKKHCVAAREDKTNGEVVLRIRYRDGGVRNSRIEVCIDDPK